MTKLRAAMDNINKHISKELLAEMELAADVMRLNPLSFKSEWNIFSYPPCLYGLQQLAIEYNGMSVTLRLNFHLNEGRFVWDVRPHDQRDLDSISSFQPSFYADGQTSQIRNFLEEYFNTKPITKQDITEKFDRLIKKELSQENLNSLLENLREWEEWNLDDNQKDQKNDN